MTTKRARDPSPRVARPESAKGVSSDSSLTSIGRTERIVLAIILLVGVGLRLADLSRSAVEHFDEAVYASNLLFGPESGYEWPGRQFFAPPLLPLVIEWLDIAGLVLFGSLPVWWPLVPAWLCGVATIPSLWWIGRQWFGPAAGLLAAGIIALSGIHSAYGATALTDVPLTLALLWGSNWFWKALVTESSRDAVIAGLITAIAWWTKYNGWLVLAIGISGGLAAQLVLPPGQRRFGVWLRTSLIATIVAVAAWSPVWLWDAAKVGGYDKIAANHQGYMHGLNQWPTAAVQQLSAIASYDPYWIRVGPALALLGAFVSRRVRFIPAALAGGLIVWTLIGSGGLAAISIPLGLAAIPALWRDSREESDTTTCSVAPAALTGWCLVFAAVLGLTLSTPFYRPYPRLMLPWLAFTALLWGALFGRWLSKPLVASVQPWKWIAVPLLITASLGGALRIGHSAWPGENRFAAVQSAARIARTLRDQNAGESPVTFLTGDPALFHQLLRRQNFATAQVNDLKFLDQPPPAPVYLILGYMAGRDETFQAAWKPVADRFELVDEFEVHPSRIVLFDFDSPATFAAHPERKTMTQRVYRLKD